MKKKFSNAKTYRNYSVTEMIVKNGKTIQIGDNLSKYGEEVDLKGKFVLPPYADPYLYLGYVYVLAEVEGIGAASGTLCEAIENWPRHKVTMTIEGVKKLTRKGIEDEVSQGVQLIHTRADVTDPKPIGFRVLMELREEMRDIMGIQVVAPPQNDMYIYKSGRELMEEALKMGADVIGGIPHYEPVREFGEKSIHDIVELAMKCNVLIDVRCDEADDTMVRFIEILSALVYPEDYGTRTTASHTCLSGSVDNSYTYRVFDMSKKNKMNFTSCPIENVYLQGRQDIHPRCRGLTRIKEFMHMGINVALARDSINDPWYPLGNGNIMNILDNTIYLSHYASPEGVESIFDMTTYNGAKCMNIHDAYGLEGGKDANFVVLDGDNSWDCIHGRTDVLASVRKGKSLFKKKPTEYEIPFKM